MMFSRSLALLLVVCVLNLGAAVSSRAQVAPMRKQFPPGSVRAPQDLPVSKLRSQIERLPKAAQDRAVAWLGNFHFTDLDLASLQADAEGGIYYADAFELAPVAQPAASDPVVAAAAVPVSPFPANLIFHSKPGAPNVIYLNFSGETVQNTAWNTSLGRSVIPAVPYSSDSDRTTFSDSEQLSIRRIWQRVSEDYAAFNVDVTTERPATFTTRTAEAVITRNTDANGLANPSSTAGGVSYVGAFATSTYAQYRPAWIYDNNLAGEESYIGEATSHEIGHNMGLSHDGTTAGDEYYRGHGSGDTSWGPIMGASYGRNVTQWSKGDYYLANNTEDDLAIIAGKLSYRTDDHGNTLASATPLVISGGVISSTTPETDPTNASPENKGILERNTDVDWFSFSTGNGPISLTVNPWVTPGALTKGGNIDIEVDLYDAAGNLLLTNNSTTITYATIQTNLTEGVYYIAIKDVAAGDPFSSTPTGYTTYGGIGQYFISGTVIPSNVVIPPGATLAASDINSPGVGTYNFTVTYTDNVAVDVSTIDSNDVIVTGPNGYSQTAAFVSVDVNTDGTPRVATYSITPPAGANWTQGDNGIYTVTLLANSVGDTEGAFVPVMDLGTFNVAVPNVIYSANMDTNPGWTLSGQWQYGIPTYSTGTGPSAGYTGTSIVGYNLAGNYANKLSTAYATTPTIDCSKYTQLTLRFRRWLRLRSGDTATIQASTNGTTWTTVYSTTKTVSDSSWQDVQYSLPASMGASSTLRLRWGLASNTSGTDIGWNIDDVLVLGNGEVDSIAPVATINVANIVNGGSPVQSFTVTYTDNVAVSAASVGPSDLYVLGPNGFSNVVDFAGIDIPTDGTPRVATYTLSAPNSLWSSADNGTYQVYIAPDEVSDTANNFIAETLLGSFTVAISDSHQALVVTPVALTIPEGTQSKFAVSLAEQPSANVTVTIVPVSGDTNVLVADVTPIVFTPTNWNVPVPVTVSALADADRVDNVATFEVRSDGLASVSVLATQTDTTPDPNLDTAPPTAALNVANIITAGSTPQTLTVTYTDNVAVSVASVGDGDLYVLGPNGFSNRVAFASLDVQTDGTPRVATYTLSAPNGGWSTAANGTYEVHVAGAEVSDTSSNSIAETLLGTFSVAIPQPIQQALIVDPTSFTILEGATGSFSVKLAAQPASDVTVTFVQVSGGTNVALAQGTPIVFTAANWNIPVAVDVLALNDADRVNDVSTFEVRSAGLASVSVTATQTDTTPPPILDTFAPTAALDVTNIVVGSSAPQTLVVTYTDNVAVSVASLGDGDLYVTGPNAFSNRVAFASVDISTDGTPRIATYTLSAPNGGWSTADNGTYEVHVAAGEVSDTSSNSIADTLLGTFTIAIPQPIQQALIVDLTSLTIVEGATGSFSVKLAAQPATDVTVNIVQVSGGTNVVLADVTPIVFTAANWNIPVAVDVLALNDTDRVNDVSTFEVRSEGLTSVSVTATQTDTTPDPNSVPLTFSAITDSSGNIGMTIDAVAGVSYTLQSSTDFQNWTDIETKVADGATVSFSTTDTGEPARFYRIKR